MAACGCGLTRNHPDRSLVLSRRWFVVCHARRAMSTPQLQEAPSFARPLLWTAGTLAGAALLAPGPAGAHESKPWMPRRHYRGLKEARKPPEFEKSQIWGSRHESGQVDDVKTTVQRMTGAVKGAFGGNEGEGFTMKKALMSKPGQVTLQGMSGPTSRFTPVQQTNSVPIWLPVLGVVAIFLVAFWGRLKGFFTGEGKTSGGRWIRDRSLGGKMVFITDDAPAAKSTKSTTALPDVPASASTLSGYSAMSEAPKAERGRPSWYVYSPPLPVTPTTEQECRKRAKRILKGLENQKLSGKDYAVLSLIQLYQTCREGNVQLTSPSITTAACETMVRDAVQGTLASAGQSASLTRTVRPSDFVCGLAHALGLKEERLIVIVHAAVAAHVRSLLLNAAASLRSENLERANNDLGRVISAVDMYPLPASAPEAEVVASAVRDKLTLTETESLLKQLALRAPQYMELFTVMLGFDVSLTLPMLQQVVAEADTQKQ